MSLPDNLNQEHFPPVLSLIQQAKARALSSVNQQLLELYWQIGEYLSLKVVEHGWGQGTVKELAQWLAEREPNLRGFSAQNLWRMRQFYETYAEQPKLSPLVRALHAVLTLVIVTDAKLSAVLRVLLLAQYQTRFPDKALLQAKLDEFYELAKMESGQ